MPNDSYSLTRYLGIDSASSPTLAVDGTLVFLADTTGTPQVWSLEDSKSFPTRLTAHDERVSFVSASPSRPEVVFGMDTGSDEHDQLYRYDLESGTETALTATPEAIHQWGDWNPDGERIAFTANRREGSTFDVYVQGRDDPAATLVHEGAGGFLTVETWGEPGLVLSTANASSDQNLFLLDPDSGEHRRLTDDTEARYHSVGFGPDGNLYCVTDHGADTTYVARLNPDDGTSTVVEEGGDWNVSHLSVHGGTGRVVWSRNVDGYSEVHAGELVGDGDTLSVEPTAEPHVLDGVLFGAGFGPDGERCALTLSRSDDPQNVYLLDPETGSVEQWTDFGTLGIPRDTFLEPEIVRYESFDGREIPAYWTLPPNTESGETPVIVDIHGGPQHQRRPWFYPTKQYFLQQGYAIFEPNVRGSSGYGKAYTHLDDTDKRMNSVADIEAAVQWLHERDAVDPDRIVAYGRSYGGFMVLAAITEYPDLWAAAVDFVGIADFETFLENTGEWRRSHREQEYGSLDNPDLLRRISPIHKADRIACPLFIQHGANDPRVPVGEAEQIAEKVREQGLPVETCIFEDEGHHTTSRENLVEEFERISDFLDEHV